VSWIVAAADFAEAAATVAKGIVRIDGNGNDSARPIITGHDFRPISALSDCALNVLIARNPLPLGTQQVIGGELGESDHAKGTFGRRCFSRARRRSRRWW
jgi:hypothetical protein